MSARQILSTGLVAIMAASASATSIKLHDGSVMRVDLVRQLALPGSGNATADQPSGAMRFSVVEPTGRTWSGIIPGSEAKAFGDASIAQSPVTGDVFTVFARYVPGGSEVAFAVWTGQTFTDASELASETGDDVDPVLAFGDAGDAVLSWKHVGLLPSVYVRHFELGRSGPTATHSFSDLGAPDSLIHPASGPVGLKAGVSHAIDDSGRRFAYVFLASDDGEGMGLVRLNLDALVQGGGFNAPPVPVSLSAPVTQSTGPLGSVGDRPADAGSVLSPWRLVLSPDTVAYYWTESDRLALVLFRNAAGGRLITVPLPASDDLVHATAFQAALREVARLDRRTTDRPVVRHR